jgi:predicted HTH domain antitoxin
MSKKQKRTAHYSREKAKLFQLIKEYIANGEFYQYDPILKRAIELGRDKHLPLDKAIEIAEQELSNT